MDEKKWRWAMFLAYLPDWTIGPIIGGTFFYLQTVQPFKREFSLNDISIQHTHIPHERVSNKQLFIIGVVSPLLSLTAINLIAIGSVWDLFVGWTAGLYALAVTGVITGILKVTAGRPRPDCIARCQPRVGAMDSPVFGLVNTTICTQTNIGILNDGFRSFPSDHSGICFAGLGFLSFYIAGKLHMFDKKGHTLKAWTSAIPLVIATLVAISRTMDNRHHWEDILAGGLIGFLMAWFCYRQFYPPLDDPSCHIPYPPRVPKPTSHPEKRGSVENGQPPSIRQKAQ